MAFARDKIDGNGTVRRSARIRKMLDIGRIADASIFRSRLKVFFHTFPNTVFEILEYEIFGRIVIGRVETQQEIHRGTGRQVDIGQRDHDGVILAHILDGNRSAVFQAGRIAFGTGFNADVGLSRIIAQRGIQTLVLRPLYFLFRIQAARLHLPKRGSTHSLRPGLGRFGGHRLRGLRLDRLGLLGTSRNHRQQQRQCQKLSDGAHTLKL